MARTLGKGTCQGRLLLAEMLGDEDLVCPGMTLTGEPAVQGVAIPTGECITWKQLQPHEEYVQASLCSWMEGMEADFWQYVEAESRSTQNLVSERIGPELQNVHQELLDINHAAQVLLLLHPLVCLIKDLAIGCFAENRSLSTECTENLLALAICFGIVLNTLCDSMRSFYTFSLRSAGDLFKGKGFERANWKV